MMYSDDQFTKLDRLDVCESDLMGASAMAADPPCTRQRSGIMTIVMASIESLGSRSTLTTAHL